VTTDFPKATSLLDAHHHERTRPNASGAVILSVVIGQRRLARQAFAAWATASGLGHTVAACHTSAARRRALAAWGTDTALLFVPPRGATAAAATAALELAHLEPQRAIGVALTVTDIEALLTPEREFAPELRRALLGGLVFATPQAQRAMPSTIRRERDALYRSDHENALHVLMCQRADIGDVFAVNRRVRVAPGAPAFEIDFWASSLRLAVEVDGRQHATPAQRRRDDRRDGTLTAAGVRTLRIHAAKVISDPTATLNQIAALIADRRKELEHRANTAD
jgi:very-short-patch-repair endonuclease